MSPEPDAVPSALPRLSVPRLSIIVPTYDRPQRIQALVAALAAQTLAPGEFELVVVDDGSRVPVSAGSPGSIGPTPFFTRVLRQANAGPAAARNLALEHCRGALCLILNDDALPAPDLLAVHLARHAEHAGEKLAVLGTFRFSANSRRSAFVELLDQSDLLFDFSSLKDGALHDWRYFWTCNISLPTAAVRDAGGFDAHNFPTIVEDCELGYRLERAGFAVLHDARAVCEHEHVLAPRDFFARTWRLGQALARMFTKWGDARMLRQGPDAQVDQALLLRMQATCERLFPQFERAILALEALEAQPRGAQGLSAALVARLAELVGRVNAVPLYAGMLAELTGHDPLLALRAGPRAGALTSVIVLSKDDRAATARCIEALRRHREPQHPFEIICVDNGSSDGSREYLLAQRDVRTIQNEANLGAPLARNQALAQARGDWIVFMDNDVVVTPQWLSGLLYHATVDGRSGCVGPLTDRAAHGQQIETPELGTAAELDLFALAVRAREPRNMRFTTLMSSFCLLVRRSLIDAIGGFDERFSPWGFEDDDFALRAALSGAHNRIALDVFVQHRAYGGIKLATHTALLERNWKRFASKWGLPADAAHGDYTGLEAVVASPPPPEALHVPVPLPAHGPGSAGTIATTGDADRAFGVREAS